MKNANRSHKESLSLNDRIALRITSFVGSMWCAYGFALLALVSLPDAIKSGRATLVAWIAQTFLQLVLLSVIMVGQNLQSRHSELLAEADYEADKDTHELLERIERLLREKLP